ncbi:MAG: AMP-binding protein [Verrucomicrobia bacterium]|nr:AMP-binding protein [Verrucomicrobiota bacterium]
MKQVFIRSVLAFISLLLRIRYRITYKGQDALTKALKGSDQGILFLPNHPAIVIDPLISTIPLLRRFSARSLIIAYMYFNPLYNWAMRLVNALPIPDFSTGFNPLKLSRMDRCLKTISDGLKKGESFVIYPAGMTKSTAKEVIGGTFGVHQLIEENPGAKVVLVRMSGLWGSSFSRALTSGASPNLPAVFKMALKTFFKNGFFFVPKREVTVAFELAGADFPSHATKTDLNRYLEQWYNKPFGPEGEPLNLVSYCFWKKELPEVGVAKRETNEISGVPLQMREIIVEKVAELAKVQKSQVLPDLYLAEHLGLDSLNFAELVSFLEDQFEVEGIIPEDLTTVGRLFVIANKSYTKKETKELYHNMRLWNKPRKHTKLAIPEAKNIPASFFKACDGRLFEAACADPIAGVTSYYKLKRGVLVLSEHIAKLPGKHIGVLLPSSPIANIITIAIQLAGKVPVMINWTVGGKHLDAVIETAGIQVVLSSWRFLDRLENVDLSAVADMLIMLEEMKAEIGVWNLVKASINALLPSSSLLKQCEDVQEEAVILFTSGTESMPKGVPLTHHNLLSNQAAAIEDVQLFADDILLGMLPPFHSFGFSITGLLPLLCGLRVAYYPNPTDSKRLVKAIEQWKVSLMCSAPTFLRNIMNASQKQNLASLRMIISGAEKAPDDLYTLINKQTQATLCEGYGITECAPVLTVNTTGQKVNGVGKPIRGVELRIVDAENTKEEKKVGEAGLVLARGPNVFSGYLNSVARDPFIEVEGERWYQTGDLGFKTPEGNLILSGRLKRFVKIGGEMVSLAAIEETLTSQRFGKKKSDAEQFVVFPVDDALGKVQLVLFTVHPLEVSKVNQLLRKCGCSSIAKIDRIIELDAIPLTGAGKVAYRELEKML